MSAQTPVAKDHPLMIAWEKHKATEDYANSKKWAVLGEHVEGSLWALFVAGWDAAGGLNGALASSPSRPAVSKEFLARAEKFLDNYQALGRQRDALKICADEGSYIIGEFLSLVDPENWDKPHASTVAAAPALGEGER